MFYFCRPITDSAPCWRHRRLAGCNAPPVPRLLFPSSSANIVMISVWVMLVSVNRCCLWFVSMLSRSMMLGFDMDDCFCCGTPLGRCCTAATRFHWFAKFSDTWLRKVMGVEWNGTKWGWLMIGVVLTCSGWVKGIIFFAIFGGASYSCGWFGFCRTRMVWLWIVMCCGCLAPSAGMITIQENA